MTAPMTTPMTTQTATRARGAHAGRGLGTAIARILLVCAMLVASLGSACNTLEKLDKQSDDLLDEISDPGRSSAGSSSGDSGSSGLSVVERRAMPMRTVKDARGNPIKLWGQADSSSTTPGHANTIAAEALEMATSGKYEYVTMQRSWRTATGRTGVSRKIPDIIGVRYDGKVDAFEVKSKSDDEAELMQRLKDGMNTLPPERRGDFDVLKPDR